MSAATVANTPSASDTLSADLSTLRAEVFRLTGVALPADDPALAIVLLDRLVIDRYTSAFEERVKEAVGARLDAIRVQAAKWAAEEMISYQLDMHERLEVDLSRHTAKVERMLRKLELGGNLQIAFWVVLGGVLAVLLLFMGVLIGRFFVTF